MSRKRRNRRDFEKNDGETKSSGLCQKCDNMDPEAFKFELFCAMGNFLDPETKTVKLKAFRLYTRVTCQDCSATKTTVDRLSFEKAIGKS